MPQSNYMSIFLYIFAVVLPMIIINIISILIKKYYTAFTCTSHKLFKMFECYAPSSEVVGNFQCVQAL